MDLETALQNTQVEKDSPTVLVVPLLLAVAGLIAGIFLGIGLFQQLNAR